MRVRNDVPLIIPEESRTSGILWSPESEEATARRAFGGNQNYGVDRAGPDPSQQLLLRSECACNLRVGILQLAQLIGRYRRSGRLRGLRRDYLDLITIHDYDVWLVSCPPLAKCLFKVHRVDDTCELDWARVQHLRAVNRNDQPVRLILGRVSIGSRIRCGTIADAIRQDFVNTARILSINANGLQRLRLGQLQELIRLRRSIRSRGRVVATGTRAGHDDKHGCDQGHWQCKEGKVAFHRRHALHVIWSNLWNVSIPLVNCRISKRCIQQYCAVRLARYVEPIPDAAESGYAKAQQNGFARVRGVRDLVLRILDNASMSIPRLLTGGGLQG